MGRKTNPQTDAAKAAWLAAPKKEKPTVTDLMEKHGLARATAYRNIVKWEKEDRRLNRKRKAAEVSRA